MSCCVKHQKRDGFSIVILEAVVTTTNADGTPNIAPMGPEVSGCEFQEFVLRPFQTATTFQNLTRHGEGVLHVVDDVEMLARAALDLFETPPPMRHALQVSGWILEDACRWYEFRVRAVDDREARAEIIVDVVDAGCGRDFFGFNRAKHAVVEATILATRVEFLGLGTVMTEIDRLWVPVRKTGGEAELRAMGLVDRYVQNCATQDAVATPDAEGD